MPDPSLEDLLAKQAIRDVLSRYCRGLDRMDKEMAYAVWHDGGTADYIDMYEGSGRGFIDWVWEAHEGMDRHSHQITNVLTEVDGDRAASEAYVTVVLWVKREGAEPQTEIVCRGRYLDRWAKRDGRWAIEHRVHVLDTQTIGEITTGPVSKESTRDASDASFEHFRRA